LAEPLNEAVPKEHFHYEWHQRDRINTSHTKLSRLGTCAVVKYKGVSDRRHFTGQEKQLWRLLQHAARENPDRLEWGLTNPSLDNASPDVAFDAAAAAFPSARQRWVEEYKRSSAENPVVEFRPSCAFRTEGNTERNNGNNLNGNNLAEEVPAHGADGTGGAAVATGGTDDVVGGTGAVLAAVVEEGGQQDEEEEEEEDGKKKKKKKKKKVKPLSPQQLVIQELNQEYDAREVEAAEVRKHMDVLGNKAQVAQEEADQMEELGYPVPKRQRREVAKAREEADVAVEAYEVAQMTLIELKMLVQEKEFELKHGGKKMPGAAQAADGFMYAGLAGKGMGHGLTKGKSIGWQKMQKLMHTQKLSPTNRTMRKNSVIDAVDNAQALVDKANANALNGDSGDESEEGMSEDESSEEEEEEKKPKSLWTDSDDSGSESEGDGEGGDGDGKKKKQKQKDDLDSSDDEDGDGQDGRTEYNGADGEGGAGGPGAVEAERVIPDPSLFGMHARQQLHVTMDVARLRMGQLEGGVAPVVCPLTDDQRQTIQQLRTRRGWKSGGKSGFRSVKSRSPMGTGSTLGVGTGSMGGTGTGMGVSSVGSMDSMGTPGSTLGSTLGATGTTTTMGASTTMGAGTTAAEHEYLEYESESEDEDEDEGGNSPGKKAAGDLASCVPANLLLTPSNIQAVAVSIGHNEAMIRSHASSFKNSLRDGYNPISTEVKVTQRQRLAIKRTNAIHAELQREEAASAAKVAHEKAVERRKWEQEQKRLGLFEERRRSEIAADTAAAAAAAAARQTVAALKSNEGDDDPHAAMQKVRIRVI
jgi:hypothetical protein